MTVIGVDLVIGFLPRNGDGGDALLPRISISMASPRLPRNLDHSINYNKEGAMEQKITLTLARADAEGLVKSLRHRKQRLCDIKQEICEPEDDFEREELGYFEQEDEVVERVLTALHVALESPPSN
jgi:hypothetical protein